MTTDELQDALEAAEDRVKELENIVEEMHRDKVNLLSMYTHATSRLSFWQQRAQLWRKCATVNYWQWRNH
jgi:hypothetical protein